MAGFVVGRSKVGSGDLIGGSPAAPENWTNTRTDVAGISDSVVAELGQTFTPSGSSTQTFVVPAGVTTVRLDLVGARGGTSSTVAGGQGGRLQTTLTVTPGETLHLRVGLEGGGTGGSNAGAGSFFGGANGGTGLVLGGGGGGGASDVRRGGTAESNRVAVAGAGGGTANNGGSVGGPGGHTLDTQATGTSASSNGANGGLSNGGGGGGGGWRGGSGGGVAGGGNGGTNFHNTTVCSDTISTSGYSTGAGSISIFYAIPLGSDNTQTLTDPLGLLDAISWVTTSVRSATDPIGLLDAATPTAATVRTQTDPLGVLDSRTVALSITVTITDNIGMVDSKTWLQEIYSDFLGITDSLVVDSTTGVAHAQTRTDALGLSDSIALTVSINITITDTLGVTDAVIPVINRIVVLPDPVGITDTSNFAATYVRARDDPVGLTDSIAAVLNFNDLKGDPVGLTDSVSWVSSASQTRTDPAGITDSATVVAASTRSRDDVVGLTDSISVVVTTSRTLTDGLDIGEPRYLTASGSGMAVGNPVGSAWPPTGWESTPSDWALNEFRLRIAFRAVQATGNSQVIFSSLHLQAGNYSGYEFRVRSDGRIEFVRAVNFAGLTTSTSTQAIPFNTDVTVEITHSKAAGTTSFLRVDTSTSLGSVGHANEALSIYQPGTANAGLGTVGETPVGTYLSQKMAPGGRVYRVDQYEGLISELLWFSGDFTAQPSGTTAFTQDNIDWTIVSAIAEVDQTSTTVPSVSDVMGLTDSIVHDLSLFYDITVMSTRQVAVLV